MCWEVQEKSSYIILEGVMGVGIASHLLKVNNFHSESNLLLFRMNPVQFLEHYFLNIFF